MRENQSVGKAVAVLQHVSQHPNGVNASELARRTAMSRMTVARLAATLTHHRMLTRRPDDRYVLGSELARLGRLANNDEAVIAAFAPGVRELREAFNEVATLELPRGADTVETVFQLSPTYVMTPNWVGQTIDLHASSAGKVFLAFSDAAYEKVLRGAQLSQRTPYTITDPADLEEHLKRVRRLGFAETDQEYELELSGVSVPVLAPGTAHELLAILSVTGPSSRLRGKLTEAALCRMRTLGSNLAAQAPPRSAGARVAPHP